MITQLVSWLVNSILSRYVANMNIDQLHVRCDGFALENLIFKKLSWVLGKVCLFLESGSIGNMRISIPFSQLNTLPWVVEIDHLKLVVRLQNAEELSGDLRLLGQSETKELLKKVEDSWMAQLRSKLKQKVASATFLSSWYSVFSSKVLDKLTVSVRTLEVAFYSSELSDHRILLSVSSLLTRCRVETTEVPASWGDPFSYVIREARLEGFTASLQTDRKGTAMGPVTENILGPLAVSCLYGISLQPSSLGAFDRPSLQVQILLEQVPLTLSVNGAQVLSALWQEVCRHRLVCWMLALRPSQSITASPAKWWVYAYQCWRKQRGYPPLGRSAQNFSTTIRDMLSYVRSYRSYLLEGRNTSVSCMKEIERIEAFFQYRQLVILRSLVFDSLRRGGLALKVCAAHSDASAQGWGSWFFSVAGGLTSYLLTSAVVTERDLQSITTEEREFLDQVSELTMLPTTSIQDSATFGVQFQLQQIRLSLKDVQGRMEVLGASIQNLRSTLSGTSSMDHWTGSLSLKDVHVMEHDSQTYLLRTVDTGIPQVSSKTNLLEVHGSYETFKSHILHKLTVTSRALELLLLPKHLNRLCQTISPLYHCVDQIKAGVALTECFTHVDAWQLHHMGKVKPIMWDLKLDIALPRILLPEDADSPQGSVMIADHGFLTLALDSSKAEIPPKVLSEEVDEEDDFFTPPSSPEENSGKSSLSHQDIQHALDTLDSRVQKFSMKLHGLRLLVVPMETLKDDMELRTSPSSYLLDKVDGDFFIEWNQIPSRQLTIKAVFPQISLLLDESKVAILSNTRQSFVELGSKFSELMGSMKKREKIQAEIIQEGQKDHHPPSRTPYQPSRPFSTNMCLEVSQVSVSLHYADQLIAELQGHRILGSMALEPHLTTAGITVESLYLIKAIPSESPNGHLLLCPQAQDEKGCLLDIRFREDTLVTVVQPVIFTIDPGVVPKILAIFASLCFGEVFSRRGATSNAATDGPSPLFQTFFKDRGLHVVLEGFYITFIDNNLQGQPSEAFHLTIGTLSAQHGLNDDYFHASLQSVLLEAIDPRSSAFLSLAVVSGSQSSPGIVVQSSVHHSGQRFEFICSNLSIFFWEAQLQALLEWGRTLYALIRSSVSNVILAEVEPEVLPAIHDSVHTYDIQTNIRLCELLVFFPTHNQSHGEHQVHFHGVLDLFQLVTGLETFSSAKLSSLSLRGMSACLDACTTRTCRPLCLPDPEECHFKVDLLEVNRHIWNQTKEKVSLMSSSVVIALSPEYIRLIDYIAKALQRLASVRSAADSESLEDPRGRDNSSAVRLIQIRIPTITVFSDITFSLMVSGFCADIDDAQKTLCISFIELRLFSTLCKTGSLLSITSDAVAVQPNVGIPIPDLLQADRSGLTISAVFGGTQDAVRVKLGLVKVKLHDPTWRKVHQRVHLQELLSIFHLGSRNSGPCPMHIQKTWLLRSDVTHLSFIIDCEPTQLPAHGVELSLHLLSLSSNPSHQLLSIKGSVQKVYLFDKSIFGSTYPTRFSSEDTALRFSYTWCSTMGSSLNVEATRASLLVTKRYILGLISSFIQSLELLYLWVPRKVPSQPDDPKPLSLELQFYDSLLYLPLSWCSDLLFKIHFSCLQINNTSSLFKTDTAEEILQEITLKFEEVSLFHAKRYCESLGDIVEDPETVSELGSFSVHVHRPITSNLAKQVPDYTVSTEISAKVMLKKETFQLFMGVLHENLSETISNEALFMALPRWTLLHINLHMRGLSLVLRRPCGPASPPGDLGTGQIKFLHADMVYEVFSNSSSALSLKAKNLLVHKSSSQWVDELILPSEIVLCPLRQLVEPYVNNILELQYTNSASNDRLVVLLHQLRGLWDQVFVEDVVSAFTPSTSGVKVSSNSRTPIIPKSRAIKVNLSDCDLTFPWNTIRLKVSGFCSWRGKLDENFFLGNLTSVHVTDSGSYHSNQDSLLEISNTLFEMSSNRSVNKSLQSDTLQSSSSSLEINFQAPVLVRLSFSNLLKFQAHLKNQRAETVSPRDRSPGNLESGDRCVSPLEWLRHLPFGISDVKFVGTAIVLQLINDLQDLDVPFAEMKLEGFQICAYSVPDPCANFSSTVSLNYYNPAVSFFEPLLEPQRFQLRAEEGPDAEGKMETLSFSLTATEMLTINLSLAFVELWKRTRLRLKHNAARTGERGDNSSTRVSTHVFSPFVIKNMTGVDIKYLVKNVGVRELLSLDTSNTESWSIVRSYEEAPISLVQVYHSSQEGSMMSGMKHLFVQLEGWDMPLPISINRVGLFVRHLVPLEDNTNSDPVRLMLEVVNRPAQKWILLRSSLVLENLLSTPLQIKLRSPVSGLFTVLPTLQPGSSFPVSLQSLNWNLYVRPFTQDGSFSFSPLKVNWMEVHGSRPSMPHPVVCSPLNKSGPFKFCAYTVQAQIDEQKILGLIKAVEARSHPYPSHRVMFRYHLVVINKLPLDVAIRINGDSFQKVALKPLQREPFHVVHTELFSLQLALDNFQTVEVPPLRIDPGGSRQMIKVNIQDVQGRGLYLNFIITQVEVLSLEVQIASTFWIINSSGLPLIFRNGDGGGELAGQFEEHECGRSLLPLLLSSHPNSPLSRLEMRLGHGVSTSNSQPEWSEEFALKRGQVFRRLSVHEIRTKPPRVFDLGVEIKSAPESFEMTKLVVVTARYLIENRSGRTVAFAQQHMVASKTQRNVEGVWSAFDGASMFFHWNRGDLDQLLVVRYLSVSACNWSGGFRIDEPASFHVSMRSVEDHSCFFVHVEISLDGGHHRVVFSDAAQLPPPVVILNNSWVPVSFKQLDGNEQGRGTIINPGSSFVYALDEPLHPPVLLFSAYNENQLGVTLSSSSDQLPLHYNNTFMIELHRLNSFDSPLVFDLDQSNLVVLRPKCLTSESQTWNLTQTGQLVNQASTNNSSTSSCLVLDVENNLDYKGNHTWRLVMKPYNLKHQQTQSWSFNEGFLSCQVKNSAVCCVTESTGNGLIINYPVLCRAIPRCSRFVRVPLRPGSGKLLLSHSMRGPTVVVDIEDTGINNQVREKISMPVEQFLHSQHTHGSGIKFELSCLMKSGIGLSIIDEKPEEILFISLSDLSINIMSSGDSNRLKVTINDIQVDNQVFGSMHPVVLYRSLGPVTEDDSSAFCLTLHHFCPNSRLHIFQNCILDLCSITIKLEDHLMVRMLHVLDRALSSGPQADTVLFSVDGGKSSPRKYTPTLYFFFDTLNISGFEVLLSLFATDRIPPYLAAARKKLPIPIVSLDNAFLEFKPFRASMVFTSFPDLTRTLKAHFMEAIRDQAVYILLSLNALGNPLGLINDLSTGMEGLVRSGNVGGLLASVAHGISNSVSKATGSLADSLWAVSADRSNRDDIMLRRLGGLSEDYGDYLVAGFHGLGMGLFSGLTSMVVEPIEGARQGGLEGFASGLFRGLIGTLLLPAAGVLDLTSGTFAAIQSKTRPSLAPPKSIRQRRHCVGLFGQVTRYCKQTAEGQELVHTLNGGSHAERFISMDVLRRDVEKLKVVLTNGRVYALRCAGAPGPNSILCVFLYSSILSCSVVTQGGMYILQFTTKRFGGTSQQLTDTKSFRCSDLSVAQEVASKINYFKYLADDEAQNVADPNHR